MTKIILTRHGHVEGITLQQFRGRADLPLTGRGRAQAILTARRIAEEWRPSAIYTSPLSRCTDTGRAIAAACNVSAEIMDGLQDLDYGDWTLKSRDAVREAWPDLYAAWLSTPHLVRMPNGESLQDLVIRTANGLRFVLERHPSESVVLVGHDSVNRALLLQLLDQPLSAYWRLSQDPCALNEIDIERHRVRVHRINETGHLRSAD